MEKAADRALLFYQDFLNRELRFLLPHPPNRHPISQLCSPVLLPTDPKSLSSKRKIWHIQTGIFRRHRPVWKAVSC